MSSGPTQPGSVVAGDHRGRRLIADQRGQQCGVDGRGGADHHERPWPVEGRPAGQLFGGGPDLSPGQRGGRQQRGRIRGDQAGAVVQVDHSWAGHPNAPTAGPPVASSSNSTGIPSLIGKTRPHSVQVSAARLRIAGRAHPERRMMLGRAGQHLQQYRIESDPGSTGCPAGAVVMRCSLSRGQERIRARISSRSATIAGSSAASTFNRSSGSVLLERTLNQRPSGNCTVNPSSSSISAS